MLLVVILTSGSVLAVCQSRTLLWRFVSVVHYSSGLSFLTAVCPFRQWFLKTISHSDLGNKPLPISFLGSGLVLYLHSGLPPSSGSGLVFTAVAVWQIVFIAVYLSLRFSNSGLLQSKDIQAVGSDTCPPMLDRTDFESWQQRIRLYCKGKDHGDYIFQSIDEGPFKIGTCRDEVVSDTDSSTLGPERDRVVADLSQPEKDRLRADIRATNILLQGLPRDIYKLINHNTYAKDIWDNVKMLLEGSELTKDDRESQLYDEFEHSRQHKGENIHDCYVRFTKLINDMRHIKMTMPKIQLNSKFYPSSSSVQPQSSYIPPVTYQPQFADNTQPDTSLSPANELLDNLTKQGRQNRVQGNNARGVVVAGNGVAQNRAGNANTGQGKPIKCYNCNGMENGVDLDEEQLLFLAGGQANTFDDEVDEGPVQDMAQNEDNIFQADQCDTFDSDVDEAPTAQTMFMTNLVTFHIFSNDIKIKLNKEFLVELRKNIYHGTYNEDVVDHIAKLLKMVDLIYVPGVDSHQLQMKVFHLSLADDAKEWWISEGDGKITTWEELVETFFCRFYPKSYDGEDEMLDEGDNWGIDPLEFLSNMNASFKNHKKVDGRTKKVLFHAWMNGNWNKRRMDDIILSSNNTTTNLFFRPYLITHGKSDTKKEDEQSLTKRKYSNTSNLIDEKPNKRMYKAKKIEAIKYSLRPNEEYIAIRGYEFDIWERNEDNLSIIYQDIFQKKDDG
ncbi:hypothetical protein Tco_0264659 [Tanacetum coccineum]